MAHTHTHTHTASVLLISATSRRCGLPHREW